MKTKYHFVRGLQSVEQMVSCDKHPNVAAVAACRACFRPLCEVCAIRDSAFVPRCPACTRKRSRTIRVALGAAALFTTAGLACGFRGHSSTRSELTRAVAPMHSSADSGALEHRFRRT